MNDPHVVALEYALVHVASVGYTKAGRFVYDTPLFRVVLDSQTARFEFKDHFAEVDAARESVEPFIREWEFSSILERGPGEFALRFRRAELIDRSPGPGQVNVSGMETAAMVGAVTIQRDQGTFPTPPSGLRMDAASTAMIARYARYKEGRDTLAAVGYFCLTVLEDTAGGPPKKREKAVAMFGIERDVLDTLGRLTGEKGGVNARKAVGLGAELSSDEVAWIESAMAKIIRRAAQVAFDPSAASIPITNASLPPLP